VWADGIGYLNRISDAFNTGNGSQQFVTLDERGVGDKRHATESMLDRLESFDLTNGSVINCIEQAVSLSAQKQEQTRASDDRAYSDRG
jgi:hypothetical protein